MANIDLFNIENARIHELRDFARKVGVISPTTMKKEDIIKNVLGIARGEIEPFKNPPKHGRPARSHVREEMSEVVAPSIDSIDPYDKKYDTSTEPIFEYKLASSDVHREYGSEECFIKEGYLDVSPQGYGCIRCNGYLPSNKDVFISADMIKESSLRAGDFVKGYVKQPSPDKPFIMFSVIGANGGKFANHDFMDMPYAPYSRSITIGSKSVYAGSRNYMNVSFSDIIRDVSLVKESKVIFLNLKAMPEQIVESSESFEYIPVYFNKTEADIISATNLVVSRCKRLVEMGENIVLFIYNFSELLKAYNVALTTKYDLSFINYQATVKVKDILFSAKNIDDEHSLTIIAIDRDNVTDTVASVIKSEFSDIFNMVE